MISNGGSTDATCSITSELVTNNAINIIVVDQENLGVSAT